MTTKQVVGFLAKHPNNAEVFLHFEGEIFKIITIGQVRDHRGYERRA